MQLGVSPPGWSVTYAQSASHFGFGVLASGWGEPSPRPSPAGRGCMQLGVSPPGWSVTFAQSPSHSARIFL